VKENERMRQIENKINDAEKGEDTKEGKSV
jgi:hypothetical protein